MRILILTFILALFALPPNAGAAENGLSYTVLGAPDSGKAAPKVINLRNIEPAKPAEPVAAAQEDGKEKPSPMQDVWERYKDLAAGRSDQKPVAEGQVARPGAPIAPTIEKVERPATGIAGLIGQYQDNKAKRGRMQSVNVNKAEQAQ